MLQLKSNKINVLPIRRKKKTKRNSNTVVISATKLFALPIGGIILIPLQTKTLRVSREKSKELIQRKKKINWDKFFEDADARHPFDLES